MSRARRLLVPVAAGALAAAATFGVLAPSGGNDGTRSSAVAGASARTYAEGRAVYARMGCGSCHRLAAAGSTGTFGPDLDTRLVGYTAASLSEQIVRPAGASASIMPEDFGERMSAAELDALVAFLLATRASG